ncbi:DUF418 domain-containing protein [Lentibacillus sediminis]|uniref:DUF418 domain-containing protein n=1 Tax=Lentibacillus sediminis TaxID=1940529 RepID=UPI000C1C3DE0|nr:DUF418 domain-containing protein [Lentibacillus sediminis]
MEPQAAPTKEANRLQWVDAARGFAIFGIFMVNIGSFSAPYFLYGGEREAWPAAIDQFAITFIDVFFQASFYTLFSILFGFGFQMMKDRLEIRGTAYRPFLTKRLFILIGFGLVHAFLIWHGDILLSYGIIGLLMLPFLTVRGRTLLIWAAILLGGSVGFFTLMYYLARDFLGFVNRPAIQQALVNYQSGSLTAIWSQNYVDWVYSNGVFGYVIMVFMLLPLFLFGMFLAKRRFLQEPGQHRAILVRLWVVSLVLFLLLKLGPYAFGNPVWFSYMQDNLGGTASALFYILSITLLAQRNVGYRLVRPFTYVGRMALSNYIAQSLISFVLFYGVGFGLYGSINPSLGIGIVVIIFSLQVLASKWWMARFSFGPLEWLWRSLTYGKRQPFRRERSRKPK